MEQTSNHHEHGHHQARGPMGQLEAFFEEYLVKKAPFQIPERGKEFFIKVAPWITLIFMIIAVPLILAALGLTLGLLPFMLAAAHGLGFWYWLGWIFILASFILEALALPGLFKRKLVGWRFVYWGILLSVIYNILGGSISGIIGNIISLYILFQVRVKYH